MSSKKRLHLLKNAAKVGIFFDFAKPLQHFFAYTRENGV